MPSARSLIKEITAPERTPPPPVRALASMALAVIGDAAEARRQIDVAVASLHAPTADAERLWRPRTEALLALHSGDSAQALQVQQPMAVYRQGRANLLYISGAAHLAARRADAAKADSDRLRLVAEWGFWDVVGTIGQARAAAMMGDEAAARRACQDGFAAWKDADPDMPLLVDAKREYAQLATSR